MGAAEWVFLRMELCQEQQAHLWVTEVVSGNVKVRRQ